MDTVVVGHYMAETWKQETHSFVIENDIGVRVSVREKDSGHQIVDSIAPSEGKFAFTSHVAGDHQVCLTPVVHEQHESHYSGNNPQVRVHLDVIIGDSKPDNSHADRGHIVDLAARVKVLNDRLKDIRKEQQYQREREAMFRDESEKTNARAVVYSAVQGVVLVAACVWQLRTLRVSTTDHRPEVSNSADNRTLHLCPHRDSSQRRSSAEVGSPHECQNAYLSRMTLLRHPSCIRVICMLGVLSIYSLSVVVPAMT